MKLISTLYSGDEIEATLNIQPRSTRNRDGSVTQDETLIVHYRSRIGNQSLIFSPTVALVLRGRNRQQQSQDAWIPVNLFYRFTSTLSHAYHGLSTDKMFFQDKGALYVDRKIADAQARKISLFRNTLTLIPDIITSRSGQQMKAILFTVDGKPMGMMSHNEVLGMVELLDHFDVNTYTLLAGMVDEIESLSNKVDAVLTISDRIEKLLIELTKSGRSAPAIFGLPDKQPGLQWEPAPTKMF